MNYTGAFQDEKELPEPAPSVPDLLHVISSQDNVMLNVPGETSH